jgi:riboflavin synthase
MFTGIVTDVGRVRAVERRADTRLVVATAYDTATIDIGASIACNGVCLTVVDKGDDWFAVDASAATLGCTTVGDWQADRPVNLERSLRLGDELGGHIVAGHVDGVGRVVALKPAGDSVGMTVDFPKQLARFVAAKGAVAIDGVSLTVNEVTADRFTVNLIPHTRRVTALGRLAKGDRVNLEIDLVARYLARLAEVEHQ